MAIDRESDEFQGKECAVKLEGYKWQLKFEGFFFFFLAVLQGMQNL